MKRLFIISIILFFSKSFAQDYGQEGYQEKRYQEAMAALKNKEYESACNEFYFVHGYKKNELSRIALKKADSLLPFAQKNIRKKIIGKWMLKESGSNWGFEKVKDNGIQKFLFIDEDQFSFYDLDIKTNKMTLTKVEKSVFTKIRDYRNLAFDFVFSDKTLWKFYFIEEKQILKQFMIGEETENGRSEIVCGNSEYNYTRMK